MERMQRRWNSLTAEEVQRMVDGSTPEQYAHGGLGEGEYMPPYCDELTGKTFFFEFDQEGITLRYNFTASHQLDWACSGDDCSPALHTEYCDYLKSEDGIYLVQHMVRHSAPPASVTLVIDTNAGLVTMCRAHFGNGVEPREIDRCFYFGIIRGYAGYPKERHHFTRDLVGKAIEWTYHEGMPPIKHIYSTEYYYTYVMRSGDKCWVASNPADFVRVNDHLYIFSFVEERQAGSQGFFLINLDTLYDVGSFLGINSEDHFECYTVGAKGKWAAMETYLS